MARAITTTIPIVSAAVSPDIVSSFRSPGGNVTGVYPNLGLPGGKRIGLLRDLLPRATTIVLLTPLGASSREGTDAQEAARVLGLQIKFLIAGNDRELDAALVSFAARCARGWDQSVVLHPCQ
jgi:putative ABC transport system substrate-binding protein